MPATFKYTQLELLRFSGRRPLSATAPDPQQPNHIPNASHPPRWRKWKSEKSIKGLKKQQQQQQKPNKNTNIYIHEKQNIEGL